MADSTPRLVCLPLSPWSERARWALDHHALDYRLTLHVPFIGERRLRRLVGAGRERATVPVLILPDRVLTQSWDIMQYADRHGTRTPLVPPDRLSDIQRYNDLADRTMEISRALVTRALLASPQALRETLPREVPRWLRPLLVPITRHGTRWFARKYELSLDDAPAQLAGLHATLSTLRDALSKSSPHLLGTFTYADIVMAVLLQGVSPVADRYIPLGPATRRVWSQPDLAQEFADLLAWRDDLYERHRASRARRAGAA